jgi:hypothetical protein
MEPTGLRRKPTFPSPPTDFGIENAVVLPKAQVRLLYAATQLLPGGERMPRIGRKSMSRRLKPKSSLCLRRLDAARRTELLI